METIFVQDSENKQNHSPKLSIDEHIPFVDIGDDQSKSFMIRPIIRNVDPLIHDEGPHRHNYQELLWIKGGSGRHKIDQETLEITPATFYLIAKGHVHHFIEGLDLEGYTLRFTDDFLLEGFLGEGWNYRATLFSHFAIHSGLTIDAADIDRFSYLLSQMAAEFEEDNFGRIPILRHMLGQLLLLIERNRQTKVQHQEPQTLTAQIYQEFILQLEEKFRQSHHVNYYAGRLGVTSRQLSDISRQFSGKTAKQIIQDRLMLEAKRYLHYTNASVKEIAWELGYKDPSYFSKVFRNSEHVAPHNYKGQSL
ncbi:MAG: helix-turn-helix domain-containing protein [Anaerolineae bacterium]